MFVYKSLDGQGPYWDFMLESLDVIYNKTSWLDTYRYRLDRDSMHRDDFAMLKYSMDKLKEERQ